MAIVQDHLCGILLRQLGRLNLSVESSPSKALTNAKEAEESHSRSASICVKPSSIISALKRNALTFENNVVINRKKCFSSIFVYG